MMNLAETFFPSDLNQYIEDITESEDALFTALREETAKLTRLSQMLSGPVEGQFLQMVVTLLQPKHCLEIGTFTGYSALNVAKSLASDGMLTTLELNPEHANIARRYFQKSPDRDKIRLVEGNALDYIESAQQTWDFVFIDADKQNYPNYYDAVLPKLSHGGVILVDNALRSGKVVSPSSLGTTAIDALNRKAKNDPLVSTVMLTIRDGLLMIRKR